MRVSKELMRVAGIIPELRLANKVTGADGKPKGIKSTGPHRVKVIEDKIVKGSDPETGKEIEYVRYVLEKNGEKRIYETKLKNKNGELNYLVQRLAEVNEGDEVILEMKRAGVKNYVEVTPVGASHSAEVDEGVDEEMPDEEVIS